MGEAVPSTLKTQRTRQQIDNREGPSETFSGHFMSLRYILRPGTYRIIL